MRTAKMVQMIGMAVVLGSTVGAATWLLSPAERAELAVDAQVEVLAAPVAWGDVVGVRLTRIGEELVAIGMCRPEGAVQVCAWHVDSGELAHSEVDGISVVECVAGSQVYIKLASQRPVMWDAATGAMGPGWLETAGLVGETRDYVVGGNAAGEHVVLDVRDGVGGCCWFGPVVLVGADGGRYATGVSAYSAAARELTDGGRWAWGDLDGVHVVGVSGERVDLAWPAGGGTLRDVDDAGGVLVTCGQDGGEQSQWWHDGTRWHELPTIGGGRLPVHWRELDGARVWGVRWTGNGTELWTLDTQSGVIVPRWTGTGWLVDARDGAALVTYEPAAASATLVVVRP